MTRRTVRIADPRRSDGADASDPPAPVRLPFSRSPDNQPRLLAFEIARLATATTDNLCLIRGLSPRGAIVQTSCPLARGDRVAIEVRSGEQIAGVISATFPVGSSIWFDEPAEVESLLGGGRKTGARGRPRLPRLVREAPVTIDTGDLRLEGSIRNISMDGACIELTEETPLPAAGGITIGLDGLGVLAATVKWRKDKQFGIKFTEPPMFDELEAWLSATPSPLPSPDVAQTDGAIAKDMQSMIQGRRTARRANDRASPEAPNAEAAERPRERRRHKRFTTVFRLAKLVGEREELCLVRNVSSSGLKAEIFSSKSVGDRLEIDFGDHKPQAARVAWVENGYVGIAFDDQINVERTLGNVPAPDDRRARRLRFLVNLPGCILLGRERIDCTLIDISQGGARLRTHAALEVGARVQVAVKEHGTLSGTVLWASNGDAGIGFLGKLAYRELAEWINHGDNVPG